MAGGRDSVCERVNVIHASSVVYACVRACFISPRQQFVCVCVCVFVRVLKFVLVTERERRRSVIDF